MFVVRVSDNFHYMDEDETHTHGEFATWSEAVEAAREIVDRSLANEFRPGITADALYDRYVSFGDDPHIVPVPDGERFSAWDYAKQRCSALCASSVQVESMVALNTQIEDWDKIARALAKAHLQKLLMWLAFSLGASLLTGWISVWAGEINGWEGQFVQFAFGLVGAAAFFTLLMFCVLLYGWLTGYKPALRDSPELARDRENYLHRHNEVFGPIPWG